jgi:hypothetical protein
MLPPMLTLNCQCNSKDPESVEDLLALLLEAAHMSLLVEVRKPGGVDCHACV